MMKIEKRLYKIPIFGILIGIVNGLFGAGGGMVAVPLLKSLGCNQKQAHSTSVAVILPLCFISAIIYYFNGNVDLAYAVKLIIPGVVGAFVGTIIMKKISPTLLRRIFAVFLAYAGVRMILS